jgi:hypothetical protein
MKQFFIILFFITVCFSGLAQSNNYHIIKFKKVNKSKKVKVYEFGMMGGVSWYYGDLCDYFYTLRYLKPAQGIYSRYQFNYHFAVRGSINKCSVWADDKYSVDINRRIRNLSFESKITELNGIVEYNFSGLRTCPYFDYTPYVFAGLAVFNFDPITTYNNQKVRLQPLHTEGQGTEFYADRKPYALTQVSIPFGGGFKIALAHHFIIGLELGWRKTFTDYLDDVSKTYANPLILSSNNGSLSAAVADKSADQALSHDVNFDKRGNPIAKDWYMIGGLTVGYVIKSNCPPRYSAKKRKSPKRINCPRIIKI